MLKSLVNLIIFITLVIFIMIIFSSTPQYFNTPLQHSPQNNEIIFNYENRMKPILITPSHVNLITPINKATAEYIPDVIKNNIIIRRESPNGSVVESSVFDINIEYPEGKIKSKNKAYIFDEAGRKFGSIGEKLCCKILEEYIQRKVILHYRPNFLKNPKTKRNLELDMYDPVTKVAIEYNGAQHYKYVDAFDNDVNNQQYRDKLKLELCNKEGVYLIVVPYTIDTMTYDKNGELKYAKFNEEQREYKLLSFIKPHLDKIFENQI